MASSLNPHSQSRLRPVSNPHLPTHTHKHKHTKTHVSFLKYVTYSVINVQLLRGDDITRILSQLQPRLKLLKEAIDRRDGGAGGAARIKVFLPQSYVFTAPHWKLASRREAGAERGGWSEKGPRLKRIHRLSSPRPSGKPSMQTAPWAFWRTTRRSTRSL